MSLRRQLHSLQRQQRQELQTLRRAAARTRRDFDPARLIRKYPAAAFGAAALAGMMLAPRPTPRYIVAETAEDAAHAGKKHARHRKRKRLRAWFWRAILRAFPEARPFISSASAPSSQAADAAGPADTRHVGPVPDPSGEPIPHTLDQLLKTLIVELITQLLARIDIAAIAQAWLEGLTNRTSKENQPAEPSIPDEDPDSTLTPTPDL